MSSRTILLGLLLLSCEPSTKTDEVFFVRSGGVDMPVWVRGDPAAKTVIVLIAGGPGGPGMFYADWPAFQRLTKSVLIAFWDQRGAGGSIGKATPDSLTLKQFTDDLSAVLSVVEARYQHPRIVLLGHSWGGLVGNAFLSDPSQQARASAWIYVDGAHDVPKALGLNRDWAISQAQALVDAGTNADHWRAEIDWLTSRTTVNCSDTNRLSSDVYALDPAHSMTSAGLGSAWLNFSTPFDGMATLANQSSTLGPVADDGSALCQALMTDLSSSLPAITIPSLVIWGRYDRTIPLAMGQEAFTLLGATEADKSFVILEDAGHHPWTTSQDAFAEPVEQFLATRVVK